MSRPAIADLVAAQPAGRALDQAFYRREDIFARDLDLLLNRWTCVGHASELAQPGDWLTAELGAESAIIARAEDGRLHALANVCRHRGSRLCAGRGRSAMFVCPYHAWTYRLDGSLRAAREMGAGFEASDHGLAALPLEVISGLIFISFAPDPPALGAARQALAPLGDLFGWDDAKVAARRRYAIAANWKLALENYHECYHCAPAHPEFARLHTLARPKARRETGERAWLAGVGAAGLSLAEVQAWPVRPDGEELARLLPSTLAPGFATGSRTGAPLGPAMIRHPALAGGCAFAEVGWLSAFLAYPDHGVVYRFIPRSVSETEMEVLWLTAPQARPGTDFDEAELTWLWDVTSLADKSIIEWNAAGVASRAYRPGPISPMETGMRAFVERYLGELA